MPCSRIKRAASIGCVAGKCLFGCTSPARRFHIAYPDNGRCRHVGGGPLLPAPSCLRRQGASDRRWEMQAIQERKHSRHAQASGILPSPSPRHRASRRLPFAGVTPLLAPQKPRVLMHRDEARTARSESPGTAPGLCCREKTCALLFLKRRELFFQGFAHCGNASFRAAGNAKAFRLRALSPGCSIFPRSLSRLAAAGPDRNGWRTGYFRSSLRSLRFTAICSRRTSVSSSS